MVREAVGTAVVAVVPFAHMAAAAAAAVLLAGAVDGVGARAAALAGVFAGRRGWAVLPQQQ